MGFIMVFLPLNFDHITPITLLCPPTFLPLQFFVVVLTQCISLRCQSEGFLQQHGHLNSATPLKKTPACPATTGYQYILGKGWVRTYESLTIPNTRRAGKTLCFTIAMNSGVTSHAMDGRQHLTIFHSFLQFLDAFSPLVRCSLKP